MFKKENLALVFASIALVTSVGVLYYERKYANDLDEMVRLLVKTTDVIDFAEIIKDF